MNTLIVQGGVRKKRLFNRFHKAGLPFISLSLKAAVPWWRHSMTILTLASEEVKSRLCRAMLCLWVIGCVNFGPRWGITHNTVLKRQAPPSSDPRVPHCMPQLATSLAQSVPSNSAHVLFYCPSPKWKNLACAAPDPVAYQTLTICSFIRVIVEALSRDIIGQVRKKA